MEERASFSRAGARQLLRSAGNDTVAARAAAASALESDSGHSRSYPACGGGSQGGLFLPEEVAGGVPGQLPPSFVFNELSRAEILAITKAVSKALSLWNGNGHPQPNNNFMAQVEVLPIPKADALAWLDGSGSKAAEESPARYARATVMRGGLEQPDVQEYRVGPVADMVAGRQPAVLEALWRDGAVPWVKHPFGHWSMDWIRRTVSPVGYELRQLFRDSTGSDWCYGAPAGGLKNRSDACGFSKFAAVPFQGYSPPGKRWTHIKFLTRASPGDTSHLFPFPLTMQLDETSPRLADWTLQNLEFCGQGPFATAAELLAAVEAGEVEPCTADWGSPARDLSWAATRPQDPPPPGPKAPGRQSPITGIDEAAGVTGGGGRTSTSAAFESRASARTYMPHGSRISSQADPHGTGAVFAWGDWTGHAKVAGSSGLSLHDLRFRGQRILYELALQELQVAYNGFGGGGQIFIMDSCIGIGITSEALREGADCPVDATFVPVTAANSRWNVRPAPVQALCLFEEDGGMTEWRHSTPLGGGKRARVDGVRRVALVIRTAATIGNYDYTTDVRLRLDGSMDVRVTAGGYMSTVFWGGPVTAEEAPFGTLVHRHLLAQLHDHLAGFKVDIDVLGTSNTFQTQTVRVGTYEEALAAAIPEELARDTDGRGRGSDTKRRRPVATERPRWHRAGQNIVKYVETQRPGVEVGLRLNASAPAVWQFLGGKNDLNGFGQRRGYAVSFPGGTAHQLLPQGHPLLGAGAWSKYHCAVSRHKDSEPQSVASRLDGYHPEAPAVSLDSFLDGEGTDDTDLVAWVSVGLHHLPRSEDIPVVTNMGAGFALKPWNFYNGLPSRDIKEAPHDRQCAPRADVSAADKSLAGAARSGRRILQDLASSVRHQLHRALLAARLRV